MGVYCEFRKNYQMVKNDRGYRENYANELDSLFIQSIGDTFTMPKKQWYTIEEAKIYCGIKSFYMRRLVREERIPTKRVSINKKGGFKHLIDVKDLDTYLATKGRKSDGKRAFIFRADDAKYAEIKKVLDKLNTESAPRYKRKGK